MKLSIIVLFSGLLLTPALSGAPARELKLEEVLSLVRSNLTDISANELDQAAALGLIQQLGSKVQLVSTNEAPAEAPAQTVTQAKVFATQFGYLRVENIAPSLAADLQSRWQELAASNRLKGAILDLRYAKGTDYQAAARAANLFVKTDQVLMRCGEKEYRSTSAGPRIESPLAILINRQTSGAAEAFAACLREAGAALLIGNNTAGEARLFETFTLSTGQKLRIGSVLVQVGGAPLPSTGVAPDIAVNVSSLDERAYYQDPYLTIPRGFAEVRGTNELASAARARRFNEAELVRRHREGLDLAPAPADEPPAEPARQAITDPALARAIDFLKGLAVLRRSSAE